ncbi:hypothetical protein BABINDRAFT_9531 [Babjeviella inositovora NRRL Y-12698]|uniref:PRELI/MSF1 domain-containing protein n=1 Tax=Babjeviella inositovora NRRL Y-12698 TaxID=984486 RepID=A0A1E3QMU9_9ASCO|nr:uncharacterized protein BABINDRAFT_9531 [Babjeviella inositovora NRRL Y-12698]ODQ78327.1 hypothetical protein BABINDRAFT_9531 [Babjeviella inositovora NRRL Y-12698]
MVLWFNSGHSYDYDFATVTLAYMNRYPNPYATHVQSVDTIDCRIDATTGDLMLTKLIVKTGRLPKFITYFVGDVTKSWVMEKIRINRDTQTMTTYTRNLDHKKIIIIEEFTHYSTNADGFTDVQSSVKFSSGINKFGIKNKLESWGHSKMQENLRGSREGLKFVMLKVNERRQAWLEQMA